MLTGVYSKTILFGFKRPLAFIFQQKTFKTKSYLILLKAGLEAPSAIFLFSDGPQL